MTVGCGKCGGGGGGGAEGRAGGGGGGELLKLKYKPLIATLGVC